MWWVVLVFNTIILIVGKGELLRQKWRRLNEGTGESPHPYPTPGVRSIAWWGEGITNYGIVQGAGYAGMI